MSTRATIHFEDAHGRTEAIVYRHGDGYPEGLGKDLETFVKEIRENVSDTRFNSPMHLSGRWIVFDAAKNREQMDNIYRSMAEHDGKPLPQPCHMLDFLSIGAVVEDPGDIDYRYHVRCDGNPTITVEEVEHKPYDATKYAVFVSTIRLADEDQPDEGVSGRGTTAAVIERASDHVGELWGNDGPPPPYIVNEAEFDRLLDALPTRVDNR